MARSVRRFLFLFIYLIPQVTLLLMSGLAIHRLWIHLQRNLPPLISQQATVLLGHEVSIGHISFHNGQATIVNVHVAQGKTFSQYGDMASARKVTFKYDLYRMLISTNMSLSRISDLKIYDPIGHIMRSHAGWNFMTLFKPHKPTTTRPLFMNIQVFNGNIYYTDKILPHNRERAEETLKAHAVNVNGYFRFYLDQSYSWDFVGTGVSGQFLHVHVRGSYEPPIKKLILHIRTDKASLPLLANRLLPKSYNITNGFAMGQVSVVRTPKMPGIIPFDIAGDLHIDSGSLYLEKYHQSIDKISGNVTLGNDIAGLADGSGFIAGSKFNISGSLWDYKKPDIDTDVILPSANLGLLADTFHLRDKYPELKKMQASGPVSCHLSGPASSIQSAGQANFKISANIKPNIQMHQPGHITLQWSGPISSPEFFATGSIPGIRWQKYSGRQIQFTASYSKHHVDSIISLNTEGGQVLCRANADVLAKGYQWKAYARLRNVALKNLIPATIPASGTGEADMNLQGTNNTDSLRGDAIVNVFNLNLYKYPVNSVRARISLKKNAINLHDFAATDNSGALTGSGKINIKDKTVDMSLHADALDIHSIGAAIENSMEMKNQSQDHSASASSLQNLSGKAFLRDIHITGQYDNPHIEGSLNVYSPGFKSYQLDLFTTHFQADKQQITIDNGIVWRFPAIASLTGTIHDPFSQDAALDFQGDFQRLEVQDLLSLTGNSIQATGTAHGLYNITGPLSHFAVNAPIIQVDNASWSDYLMNTLSFSMEYKKADNGSFWSLPYIHGRMGNTVLNASASIDGSQHFSLSADIQKFSLSRLQTYLKGYAAIEGDVSSSIQAAGDIQKGEVHNLSGNIKADTTGLQLNNEQPGDIHARITLADDKIQSNDIIIGKQGNSAPLISIKGLSYDLNTKSLTGNISAQQTPFDMIRRLVSNSPYALNNPSSPLVLWLKKITDPLAGEINMTASFSGTLDQPQIDFGWKGKDVIVQGQHIQSFTGSAAYSPTGINLKNADITAGDSSFSAHGLFEPNKNLNGEVIANNLPIGLLKKWFPDTAFFQGLNGTADLVDIVASGAPSQPDLTLSAELSQIQWKDPRILSSREIQIEHISISQATVKEGEISADDVQLTLSGTPPPDPLHPIQQKNLQYKAYARGSIAFSWKAPFLPPDPAINLELRIKDQGLNILTAFLPNPDAQLGGTLNASFLLQGTLNQPVVHGEVRVQQKPGEELRFNNMSTVLTGLDADFSFNGDTLHVVRFSALTQVLNPRGGAPLLTSAPITMSGDLALHDGVQGDPKLLLKAPRLVLAESPLPVIGSGRIVSGNTALDLAIGGVLLRPDITGDISVSQADFRMPDTFLSGTTARTIPFNPTFNLRFTIGQKVMIGSAQLTAYIRTTPSQPATLSGDFSHLALHGSLLIEKGTLAFPTARFTIRRGGQIELRYPAYAPGDYTIPSLGININVIATTRLTAASMNGVMKRYTITVAADGPINMGAPLQITGENNFTPGNTMGSGLHLTFSSDPSDLAMNSNGLQQRVTGLLGGQDSIERLFSRNPDFGRIVSDQLTDILSSSYLPDLLDKLGLSKALGFDELSLEYNHVDSFSVHLIRRLAGPFYVSYWRRLSSTSVSSTTGLNSWEFKLSYKIRDNLQFSWSTDDQHTNAYLIEGVYSF
jgi:hypothetical protein